MKIVTIFVEKLYAFHYENKLDNEYDRLMKLWTDVVYLREYARENGITDTTKFIREIRHDAEHIQDLIEEITQTNEKLEVFFKPLNDLETGFRELSLQKGKIKQSSLRIYAIKIDKNLFVLTGGAIKITHKMSEHPDTQNEKIKLEQAKSYLRSEQIFDSDSFFELLYDL